MTRIESLQATRDGLLKKRRLAESRKASSERQHVTLRRTLRETELRLKSAKRAVLVGGPGRLADEEEDALVRLLVTLPVEADAVREAVKAEDAHIAQIEAELTRVDRAITSAKQDAVEVELLTARVERLDLLDQIDAVNARMKDALSRWHAEQDARKALGDNAVRRDPGDVPDPFSQDQFGHERTRDETRIALRERVAELEARLVGTEMVT